MPASMSKPPCEKTWIACNPKKTILIVLCIVGIITLIVIFATGSKKTVQWIGVEDYPTADGLRTRTADIDKWANNLFSKDYELACSEGEHITQARATNGIHTTGVGIKCSDGNAYMMGGGTNYADHRNPTYDFTPDGLNAMPYGHVGPGGADAVGRLFIDNENSKYLTCPEGTRIAGIRGNWGEGSRIGNIQEYACV